MVYLPSLSSASVSILHHSDFTFEKLLVMRFFLLIYQNFQENTVIINTEGEWQKFLNKVSNLRLSPEDL